MPGEGGLEVFDLSPRGGGGSFLKIREDIPKIGEIHFPGGGGVD